MVKSLVHRFKTRGTVTDHPQSGHCKSVCTEASAKTYAVFSNESGFIGHPV